MPNEKGPQFYDNLFDECLKHGIEPLVTISHRETPLHLARKYNGWADRRMIGFYGRYVRRFFVRYGKKMKYWLTLNGVNSVLDFPFMSGGVCTPLGTRRTSSAMSISGGDIPASGVDPEHGTITAPVDGRISQLADTRHAAGIEAGGMEVLIHVGVDTADMNGDGFQALVRLGQIVKKGDRLLEVNLNKINAAATAAGWASAVSWERIRH